MKQIELERRYINDYTCEKAPNLIIIADKPLITDKKEIFESPIGKEYLFKCFMSRFKAINTHVTYVKDDKDTPFARQMFFNILGYYHSRHILDLQDLSLAFVGESAFDTFYSDYKKGTDISVLSMFVNRYTRTIKIFTPWLGQNSIILPYVVLPSLSDTSPAKDTLDTLKRVDMSQESLYSTTTQLISRLSTIKDMYINKEIKDFIFEAKVSTDEKGKFIEYFTLSDTFTNQEVTYCPRDIAHTDDTQETKTNMRVILKDVLTTIPVRGTNIENVIKLFPYYADIVVSKEIENCSNSNNSGNDNNAHNPFFDIIELSTGKSVLNEDSHLLRRDGQPSAWYDKWYKKAFIPKIKNEMKPFALNKANYEAVKYEWVYDIEVFENDFLVVAFDINKQYKMVCWNDYESLRRWIKNKILIGFNNVEYDDIMVKYAIARHIKLNDPNLSDSEKALLPSIRQFSNNLIEDSIKDFKLTYGKGVPSFLSWDIGLHLPFTVKKNSLKKLTMSVLNRRNYDSSVPFDINRPLTASERLDVEKYCEMDVDNTISLFLPDPKDIENNIPEKQRRNYARPSYDIKWNLIVEYAMQAKTLNNASASFAGKLLCGEDAKANPANTFKLVDGKKQYYKIPDLALKELKGTPLLDFYLKNQHNPDYLTETYSAYLGGNDTSHAYQFGFGGIHQALQQYRAYNVVNMDVASLYPSLLVLYDLMSRGAAKRPEFYELIYNTRLSAKKEGKMLLSEGLKLILNGAIGAMLSRYNPLFDTWSNSTICVHGQLFLYILAKRLYDAGYEIIQTNTDGIMIDSKEHNVYQDICTQWEKDTGLVLEFDDIDIVQQNNVNNYYCKFTNGKVKSKGFYLSNEKFGKATSKILCNIVTDKDPLDNILPRDFVIFKKHAGSEIYDGVSRTKVEGRSLAFVVGHPDDTRTHSYYSRAKKARLVNKKDENDKKIFDENGRPVMELINTESKIGGFTENMLLVDDIDNLHLDEINTSQYIALAKNLLNSADEFGPYFNSKYVKSEVEESLQALNAFKDNTDLYPVAKKVFCQNFLFESDCLTREEQLEAINKCKDSLYRVTWSGNKSYHCIVRLDRPVLMSEYKHIWYYLQFKLGFFGADLQANQPSKYTRVPGQLNEKTGEEQTLLYYDKNVINANSILETLPKLKDMTNAPKEYKGKIDMQSLIKHINKQEWSDGSRFTSVQRLSPALISLVTQEELLNMIPIKLDKDHIAVIRSKYHYLEKEKYKLEMENNV